MTVRLTCVGHMTHDLLESGLHAGGSALYAGRAARLLGADVRVVTSFASRFVGRHWLEGLDVRCMPAEATTTFEERYVGGVRDARLLSRAAPLGIPRDETDALILCPVVGEIPEPTLGDHRTCTVLAACLQGWMRGFASDGTMRVRALERPERFAGCDLLFCSREDLGGEDTPTERALRAGVACLVITEGSAGALAYTRQQSLRVRAWPTREVDPTGAGDVFAAACVLALAEGRPLEEALTRAACAGAIAVEGAGPGLEGLVTLERRAALHLGAVSP